MPLSQADKDEVMLTLAEKAPGDYQQIIVYDKIISDAKNFKEFLYKLPSNRTEIPSLSDTVKNELESIRRTPRYKDKDAYIRAFCDELSTWTLERKDSRRSHISSMFVGGMERKERTIANRYYDSLDRSKRILEADTFYLAQASDQRIWLLERGHERYLENKRRRDNEFLKALREG